MWWLSLWNEGPGTVQLAAVLGGATIAAWTDLRSRRIPNLLTLPLAASGLVWATATAGLAGLADSAAACALLAAPFVVLFLVAGGGAGDAKLMGALGAWLGLVHGLIVLVAVTAAGAAVGIAWVIARGRGRALVNNLVALVAFRARGADGSPVTPHVTHAMPYAVAIAVGVYAWMIGLMLWPS